MKIANPAPSGSASIELTEAAAAREEAALLAAYAGGEAAAFERLFERIGPRLFAFIRRFTGDDHRAEDVYQSVLVKVARKAGGFEGRSRVLTWVYQIARHACLDMIRAESRRLEVSFEDGVDPLFPRATAAEADPAGSITAGELGERIQRALKALPDEQREVFLLKEEGDLSFEEIGGIVGCGRETAKSRMRYALERLRQSLAKEARIHGLQ